MKLLPIALALLLIAVPVFAQEIETDNEITKSVVKPDAVMAVLDTVRILAITKTAEITYRYVDAAGKSIGEEFTVIVMDVEDDPETKEDETDTSFTDSGLLAAVAKLAKTAAKLKLGIE